LTKPFRSQSVTAPHALLRFPQLLLRGPPGECVNDPQQADGLGVDLKEFLFGLSQFGRGFRIAPRFLADDMGWFLQISGQGKVFVHRVEQSCEELVSRGSGGPATELAPSDRPEPGDALDDGESRRKDVLGLRCVQVLLGRKPDEAFRR
jgi:hypothetical protein